MFPGSLGVSLWGNNDGSMENLNHAGLQTSGVTRRKFMKMAIATGVLAAAGPRVWAAEGQNEIPLRQLGPICNGITRRPQLMFRITLSS